MQKEKETLSRFFLVLIYSFLSIAYFNFLDQKLYAKNIWNFGATFALPIPYIILVAFFIFSYAFLLKRRPGAIAYQIIAMAAILPLFYLLADLKMEMRTINPYEWKRGIFQVYASGYIFFFISFFSLMTGVIFRNIVEKKVLGSPEDDDAKIQSLIFHLPIFIYSAYVTTALFLNSLRIYAVSALLLFLAGLSFKKIGVLLTRMKAVLARLVENEKLFLLVIFTAAFLIRYFWGARLLGMVGDNFLIASDDGLCYDSFASFLSQGQLIPQKEVYMMSGFGYWYFLAFIYKTFGLHNFTAVFTIQSIIGASLPVMVYLIAKIVFKSRFVAVVAAIMASLDMVLVFLTVVIGMEAIYIPLVVLTVLITAYLLSKKILNYRNAFLLGVVLGLAYNARPPELLPFPLLLAALIYFVMRKIIRTKEMIGVIASFLIGFIILISVQYIVNYVSYGLQPGLPYAATDSFRGDYRTSENTILGQMGFDPFGNLGRTVSVCVDHPFVVTKLIAKGFVKRLFFLYFLPNFGVFDPICLVNPASGYFFRFPVYIQLYGYMLIAVGVLTALIRRKDPVGIAVLLLFLFYLSARPAFFYVLNCRYRGVLIPIFILFLAYGLENFYRKVKGAYAQKK